MDGDETSNVVPFPEAERADVPRLIETAGDGPPRTDPFMALTEAIAWIASGDSRLSDAAYRHLYEVGKGRSGWSYVTWKDLTDDLPEFYDADYFEAERKLFDAAGAGELEAFGRLNLEPPEPMPTLAWIDPRLQFYDEPDTIRGQGRNDGLFAPRWSHIRFRRADVLRLWPKQEKQETTVRRVRKESKAVVQLRAFLDYADANGYRDAESKNRRSLERLHEDYGRWCRNKAVNNPLGFSRFKEYEKDRREGRWS